MTQAQILAGTYRDRLFLVRKKHAVSESGESTYQDNVIYDGVPCALSSTGGSVPEKKDGRRISDRDMVIFAGPEIIMKDMDSVIIRTEVGQVLKGKTGRTFSYAGSHGETPVRIETMA